MLIFDFDGVLMDSVREVAVTAFNTLTEKTVTREEQIPGGAFALFLLNRFHVQPIGDALPLMAWCLSGCAPHPQKRLSPDEYQQIIQKTKEPIVDRTTRFFRVRKRLVKKDRRAWPALNAPIQPIWDRLRAAPSENIVLLTNKNRDAVADLCRHFELPVRKQNIYSGDHGTTKIENMQRLMERYGSTCGYGFIDDSVKNLKEIDEFFNDDARKVSLYLASWGYCGPDGAARAETLGYQVLTMEDIIVIDTFPSIATG